MSVPSLSLGGSQNRARPEALSRDLYPRARPLGIFYAHPIVLNERQVGTAIEPSSHRAIEGVVRQEHIETA